jgi:hypothetical protein
LFLNDAYDAVTVLSVVGLVLSVLGMITPIQDLRYINSIGNHTIRRIIAYGNIRRGVLYILILLLILVARLEVEFYGTRTLQQYTILVIVLATNLCIILGLYDRYRMDRYGS